jgi:hypothetical protein
VVYVDDGSSDNTGDVARSLPAIPLDIQPSHHREISQEAAPLRADHAQLGAVMFMTATSNIRPI